MKGTKMEKIAIISDIHANITALEAVLEDIRSRNIDKIFCLGDIVIKGPNPDKVIDIIKEKCDVVIKGNCDESVASSRAVEKKYWTRMKIGENRAEYLKNLPVMYEFYMSGHLIRLFHSSPLGLDLICNPAFSNAQNRYAKSEIVNSLEMFKNTEFISKTEKDPIPDIVGYGHIHTPNLYRYHNKLLFNPGSVGAADEMLNLGDENDLTNKFSTVASYAIIEGVFDSKEMDSISITHIRVPYEISKEIENLEKSDMPGKEKTIFLLKTASTNYK